MLFLLFKLSRGAGSNNHTVYRKLRHNHHKALYRRLHFQAQHRYGEEALHRDDNKADHAQHERFYHRKALRRFQLWQLYAADGRYSCCRRERANVCRRFWVD